MALRVLERFREASTFDDLIQHGADDSQSRCGKAETLWKQYAAPSCIKTNQKREMANSASLNLSRTLMALSLSKSLFWQFRSPNNVLHTYSVINSVSRCIRTNYCNSSNAVSQLPDQNQLHHDEPTKLSVFDPVPPSELEEVGRNLQPTFSFASYVNKSKTLQHLVDLGVDLSRIEKKPAVAEFLLRLDFERNIAPYIQFLNDLGVAPENFGGILSKNILILKESFDDLRTRINYLESKRFDKEMIANIITRNPYWLTTPVSVIDGRLGWFQRTFDLSGDDVRQVVNSLPQLVTYNLNNIKVNKFVLEEELGMPKYMLKSVLKNRPRLYMKSQRKILEAFEYVHNVMNVPLDLICAQPDILMDRIFKIKERHLFLRSLGRDQFNPKLPGYVSLDSLIKPDDSEFCLNIAKSSLQSYNLFLKTM